MYVNIALLSLNQIAEFLSKINNIFYSLNLML